MIAGKNPVADVSNATAAVTSVGNSTEPGLSFWQAFQSYFTLNTTTSAIPTNAGNAVAPNSGFIMRIIRAVIARQMRISKVGLGGMFDRWTT